ncbi:MAG: hypothetical protein AAGK23_03445 [Pseudomonadota bacterium]
MSLFEAVPYGDLNSRQKENFNFHQVAARLAKYGFNSMRVTEDWQGADFIACHIDGETFLKVQLKGRLVIDRKYQNKSIHIAFLLGGNAYLYDHDHLVAHMEAECLIGPDSVTWHEQGFRSWPKPPVWAIDFLEEYGI